MKRFLLLAAPLSLAACGGPAPDRPTSSANAMTSAGATEPAVANRIAAVPPTPTAKRAADYVGRWVGVEGMHLEIDERAGGGLMLAMQYDLDHHGRYPATVTPAGLRFVRNGETLVARPSDGNATGLKWLAGRTDCLTVKPGEGYCRD